MASATLTSKGQITIPKEVRDALGIEAGDRVEFVAQERGVYTVVAATRDVRQIKGLVARPAKPVTLEQMKRAISGGASNR